MTLNTADVIAIFLCFRAVCTVKIFEQTWSAKNKQIPVFFCGGFSKLRDPAVPKFGVVPPLDSRCRFAQISP